MAAAEDQLESVVALTRLGADPAATNKTGHTALCAAARLGHAAVVGLLLSQQPQQSQGLDSINKLWPGFCFRNLLQAPLS